MRWRDQFRRGLSSIAIALFFVCAILRMAAAQSTPTSPAILDRVVAVVNNHAILWSDVEREQRFSAFDPDSINGNTLTPQRALQLLISRSLIQQQIRQEDASATSPTDEEVAARVAEVRKNLPACAQHNCLTGAGWASFLAGNELSEDQVRDYLRLQIEILRFIGSRFRQGIRISSDETAAYYHDKLVPLYAKGATIPTLSAVAPRIEEILLQQQVNVLFQSWLDNLRKQGDVEILDPALDSEGIGSEGHDDTQ